MKPERIVCCSVAVVTIGLSSVAEASTEMVTRQSCGYVQDGEQCDCQPTCDNGCQPQCDCIPTYDYVCHDVSVSIEVPTTPVPVYRFWDGVHHTYFTSDSGPVNAEDEGVQFYLANDNAFGGVPFVNNLFSGQGWFFSSDDTAATSQVVGLAPLVAFVNPWTQDVIFSTNPNDPDAVNFPGGVFCVNPPVCSNIAVDEYYPGSTGMLVGTQGN